MNLDIKIFISYYVFLAEILYLCNRIVTILTIGEYAHSRYVKVYSYNK